MRLHRRGRGEVSRAGFRAALGVAALAMLALQLTEPVASADPVPPAIVSFAPASGPVGTVVLIQGTGFSTASLAGAVSFGGVSAAVYTIDSDVQIAATVPPGASSGPVAVTTPDGTATGPTDFAVVPPPTVTGFSPVRGPVGTGVTVSGAGFLAAAPTGAVTFGGTPATYTVVSDTQIATSVPPGAVGGPIAITTPNGTGSSLVPFDVKAPIVIVFMENHEDKTITTANAPYLMGLAATQRRLTAYYANEHPSLPNYLQVASGSDQGKKGSDGVSAGSIPARSIWDQLSEAGVSWGVYQEGMSTTCSSALKRIYTDASGKNQYAMKHNPAVAFGPVFYSAECQNIRDLSAMPAVLPAVSFVTPALCNDMHGMANAPTYPADCQAGTQAVITRGDLWLSQRVPGWIAAGATVVISFDEGNTGGLKRLDYSGGHLLTVIAGSRVTPGIDPTLYNHNSLLAGVEDAYGLPRLGNAAYAAPVPLP